MKIYFKAVKLHIKKALEYKSSLILSLIAQIFLFFSYYFVIIALFSRFNNIKGFSLYEVLLCFGVIHIGYSFSEVFFRGIDKFDKIIIKGDFDRLLLRPKGIMLQVLCQDFDIAKITRLLQAFIVLIIAIVNLNIEWSIIKIICLILMIISSIIVFLSIFIIAASYCFLTVQGLEFRNLLTDGGKYLAQYPIGIFKKGFVIFFTFIVPYGFVNYYPLLYIIGNSDNVLYAFSPILVFIYLIPSLLLFKWGTKKYNSTGS